MSLALVLGIPASYVKRAQAAFVRSTLDLTGWRLEYIATSKPKAHVSSRDVDRALERAASDDDTHILGFSTERERQPHQRRIEDYFRFRWCDPTLIGCLATPEPRPFLEMIASALVEELEWSSRIKPRDVKSPLMLPECSFKATRDTQDLWRHSRSFGSRESLRTAESTIERFKRAHRQRVVDDGRRGRDIKWVDDADLVFADDGPRHARPPSPREWKFSYRIEDGFHFDVSSRRGGSFQIRDVSGERHHAGDYLNVDPHGFVRST